MDTSTDTAVDDASACETLTCTTQEECDDGVACTTDMCVVGGCCINDPDDGECPYGTVCDAELGCIAIGCMTDGECYDGLTCTDDTCLFDHTCSNVDSCGTGQHCEATGCVDDPGDCVVDDDCANGVFCDGDEWCDPEFGCREDADGRECIDSDPCTDDVCDTTADMCTFTCNPATPGCDCPYDPYTGCFDIHTTIQQTCGMGMVSYSFSQVCFSHPGLSLNCTAGSMSLAQVPMPSGYDFEVSATVPGDCNEGYNISGTFDGPDHFDGLWSATFTGGWSCALGGCANQSIVISGDRI